MYRSVNRGCTWSVISKFTYLALWLKILLTHHGEAKWNMQFPDWFWVKIPLIYVAFSNHMLLQIKFFNLQSRFCIGYISSAHAISKDVCYQPDDWQISENVHLAVIVQPSIAISAQSFLLFKEHENAISLFRSKCRRYALSNTLNSAVPWLTPRSVAYCYFRVC